MKTKMITLDAKASGEVELNDSIFGLDERADILQRMVEYQRSKAQSGNHKTKGISEIRGTTAKPFAQKGTGRARQGSRRAAMMRGGATIFGPVVRSHATKLTKKFRQLALKTALSSKQKSGDLVILKDAKVKAPKTSELTKQFAKLGWIKPLIIDATVDENFAKAARNVKHVDVLPGAGVNVYDILRHKELVLTEAALTSLQERLA